MEKLSDAERSKRYRQKHQEEVKRKNRERMAKKRQEEKERKELNSDLREFYRAKEAERKRVYRVKKKNETSIQGGIQEPHPSTSLGSYKSRQALGKAVKKATSALPQSPRKRNVVIRQLCLNAGIPIAKIQKLTTEQQNENRNIVSEFLTRSDISYTAPGMKDEVIVWKNGVKSKERKYFLTLSLREVYALFCEEKPEMSIGFSTFCKLRPANVLLLHQTPADQCKCQKCENFFLQLNALNISYESEGFWDSSLCDSSVNSGCWQGICKVCSLGQKISSPLDLNEQVIYKKWEKPQSSRLTCNIKEISAGELLENFRENFKEVSSHINIKRIQHGAYLEDKEDLQKRILHIDFAMNYSCEFQNEVQSALWSRGSVTLFTVVSYWKGEASSYLICSDTSNKDKYTVACFLKKLYKTIQPKPEDIADVEEVIWSDGPSSEFKNKFMCKFLKTLSNDYKKKFSWKYFATSHGKGAVDGVGGRAKSLVRSQVMSKSQSAPIVKDANSFYEVVRKLMPKTTILLVKNEEIPRDNSLDDALSIEGIKKYHVIVGEPDGELKFFANAEEAKSMDKLCDARDTTELGTNL